VFESDEPNNLKNRKSIEFTDNANHQILNKNNTLLNDKVKDQDDNETKHERKNKNKKIKKLNSQIKKIKDISKT
jgi:hypothetical protein